MPTNFLQWNPTEANQESDSEYSADTFRADGAVGGIFPAETGNKLFYQMTAMCAALATAISNKGYTVNDSPFSTLVSVLSNIQTLADQRGELQIMTYSPSQACDASRYLGFQAPLNGNVVISLSGQNMGDEIAFIFVQDATGSRTVMWPSNFYGFVQPDPTPSSVSVQIGKVSSDLSLHAATPNISSTGINGTPIGSAQPSTGRFTTPAAGDSSTNAATTAFVKSLLVGMPASNGYFWINGILVQWAKGSAQTARGPQTVQWLINFPNACQIAFPILYNTRDDGAIQSFALTSYTTSSATVLLQIRGDEGSFTCTPFVLGIGN